jgi:hypothetical protein
MKITTKYRDAFLHTIVFTAALSFLTPAVVKANPIFYQFTGNGSGSIGSSPFSVAPFVVTIDADTANLGFQSDLGAWGIENLSGTIVISGIGTASFNLPLFVFGGDNVGAIGFGNFTQGNLIVLNDSSIGGYLLDSNFGPITDPNSALSQFNSVGTSLGNLTYSSMSEVTFDATTTTAPEPATVAFIGVGLAALAALRRLRGQKGSPGSRVCVKSQF